MEVNARDVARRWLDVPGHGNVDQKEWPPVSLGNNALEPRARQDRLFRAGGRNADVDRRERVVQPLPAHAGGVHLRGELRGSLARAIAEPQVGETVRYEISRHQLPHLAQPDDQPLSVVQPPQRRTDELDRRVADRPGAATDRRLVPGTLAGHDGVVEQPLQSRTHVPDLTGKIGCFTDLPEYLGFADDERVEPGRDLEHMPSGVVADMLGLSTDLDPGHRDMIAQGVLGLLSRNGRILWNDQRKVFVDNPDRY